MLKTQLAARPLPLGCYWPSASPHPLAQRIRLLARRDPGPTKRIVGAAIVIMLGLAAAGSVWAARPTHVIVVPAPSRIVHTQPTRPLRIAPAPSSSSSVATSSPTLTDTVPLVAAGQADPAVEAPTPLAEPLSPVRRIRAIADRSSVAPGQAVRVLAAMVDPEGKTLVTDLTAFGSQSLYRTGTFQRRGSRYALFTSVAQRGDRFLVTAGLNGRLTPPDAGSILLAADQTGTITLPNGQAITVTPSIRAETPEEAADAQRALSRMAQDRDHGAFWLAAKGRASDTIADAPF